MNEINNPFSPGAGSQPPELAGRTNLMNDAEVALRRILLKKSAKSFFCVGLRGVGKTVFLSRLNTLASNIGYETIYIEASENIDIIHSLTPELRRVLHRLSAYENVSDKVKKSFRVLKSFIGTVKIAVQDCEVSVSPEIGVADSGILEKDLPYVIEALAEAAADRAKGVAIIIDELQYLSETELNSIIMSAHKISQTQLPLIFIGAGLPQLLAYAGNAKSYAERLFNYPRLGQLSKEDAESALQKPVVAAGARFSQEALDEIIKQTKGYPYFIQEWGYRSWNASASTTIDIEAVERATINAINHLDSNFFKVRFDRLRTKEKEYLHALAKMGPGSQSTGALSKKLGKKNNELSSIRDNLIKIGMIYSPSFGDIEFTVPLFDEFMLRVMKG